MENVTKQAQNFRDKAKEEASSVADKTRDAAGNVADKARDAASSVADRAKQAASSVAQQAGEVARSLADRPQQAATAVGSGLKSVAETIREHSPHSGMLGAASSNVADSLQHSGEYIQQKGISGMADDLTDVIRRNPIPAVLIGIGIGFLIARASRS
jgi:ElaB/YqjD/DUF883 family membrane-anchored ribosome-binding protein